MLNKDLISASIPTLSLHDKIYQALQLMSDYHLGQLPVISEEKFLGSVNEDQLLNCDQDIETLEQLQPSFNNLSVNGNLHFTEAIRLVNESNLSLMPVVDDEVNWIGAISSSDLLKNTGRFFGIDEPGGVIVLEMEKRDFSFSQLGKLVESNDANISQLNTYYDKNLNVVLVTLKINKMEIADIVATFQRYEYSVKYYFGEELYENELKNNYDHLMNYLNI
ncbi:MAG TPA: CBS domain-containing protein [Chitinophagaceae bacterium]|nr:CBS domain-containing protein [Chitinophagaceae bacterium]